MSDLQSEKSDRIFKIERVLMERDLNCLVNSSRIQTCNLKMEKQPNKESFDSFRPFTSVNSNQQYKYIINHPQSNAESQSVTSETTCSQSNSESINKINSGDFQENEISLNSLNQEHKEDQKYTIDSLIRITKEYQSLQEKYDQALEELTLVKQQLSNNINILRNDKVHEQISYNDQSFIIEGEDKFTNEINRTFKLMYLNLKETSQKVIEEKNTEISILKNQILSVERAFSKLSEDICYEKEKVFELERLEQLKAYQINSQLEEITNLQQQINQLIQYPSNLNNLVKKENPLTEVNLEESNYSPHHWNTLQIQARNNENLSACFFPQGIHSDSQKNIKFQDDYNQKICSIQNNKLDSAKQYETFQEFKGEMDSGQRQRDGLESDSDIVFECDQIQGTINFYEEEENYISSSDLNSIATRVNPIDVLKKTCKMPVETESYSFQNNSYDEVKTNIILPLKERFNSSFRSEDPDNKIDVQKVKRTQMLNLLKKEIFSEGLKQSLLPGPLLSCRKQSKTPRNMNQDTYHKIVNPEVVEQQDPMTEGLKIIQSIYESLDRKTQI